MHKQGKEVKVSALTWTVTTGSTNDWTWNTTTGTVLNITVPPGSPYTFGFTGWKPVEPEEDDFDKYVREVRQIEEQLESIHGS